MKKLLKVLMVALLALSVTACGGEEVVKDGSTFVVALGGKPKDLDPVLGGDSITNLILAQLYEGLYTITQDGGIEAALATDLKVSDDGLTYTVTIADDAKWSDGEPVTAHDFVYAIKRNLRVSNAFGDDASYMQLITNYIVGAAEAQANNTPVDEMNIGVEATDDHTLVLKLKQVTPYFNLLLTSNVYLPAREDFASSEEGTWANSAECPYNGPFKVESVDTDSEVVIVKNENYRGAANVSLEKVVYKVMESQESQYAAFQTGEIDFATYLTTESVLNYEDQSAVYAIDPFVVNYFVLINADACTTEAAEALSDVRVRQALSYAIDREALLKAMNGGSYYYELNGFVPEGMTDPAGGDFRLNANTNEGKYAYYDLDKAKQLLADAGYGEDNPLKLEYYYNESTMHTTAAESLQASWKAAGIEVTLRTNDVNTFFSERASGGFELARHAMSADYNDPNAYLDMYIKATQTTAVIDDDHYDDLIAKANVETDPVKRSELLHEAERYLVQEQMYVIPLFGYGDPYMCNPDFTGLESNPTGHVHFENVKYIGE